MANNLDFIDLYNKHAREGQGTLMQNWWEERELRENTGIGRTIHKEHQTKTHNELYDKPTYDIEFYKTEKKKQDDTKLRVHGELKYQEFQTYNSDYGKAVNKASQIPKVGPKAKELDQKYLEQIQQELQEQEEKISRDQQIRHFETTQKSEFSEKDLNANVIGKKVMRDQNGKPIEFENRDLDFLAEQGIIQRLKFRLQTSNRQPITNKESLTQVLAPESYQTQTPITLYTEKINNGYFYMSKPELNTANRTSFGLNNEFVKQFPQYKHYND